MSFKFQFTSPLLAIRMLFTKLSKLVLKSIEFIVFNVGSLIMKKQMFLLTLSLYL